MKIWEIRFIDDNYDALEPKNDWNYDEITKFDGRELLNNWKLLELVKCYPEKNNPLNDAPTFLSGVPLVNNRTKKVIKELIGDAVEFLPTSYENKNEFWIVNVTNVLDCINYNKAEPKRYSNNGRVMYFNRYSFFEDKVKNQDIFKIVECPRSYVFVSDKFKDIIEKNKITGFTFTLVWDSEMD